MEEKSNKGGKRKGAGRKPLLNPKQQVSLYIEKNKFYKFGSEERMKEKIYSFVDNYGEEQKSNISIQDYTKPTNEIKPFEQPKTNFGINTLPKEVPVNLSEFDALKEEIYECRTVPEIENVMRKVKGALMFPKEKQTLEAIAKQHSKDFFTD